MTGIGNPVPLRIQRPERACQQHAACSLTHPTVIDPSKDAPRPGCFCGVCRSIKSSMRRAQLRDEMPTVMAVCGGRCNDTSGKGTRDSIFSKAFSEKKFAKGPVCDNCESPMVAVNRTEPA